MTALTERRCAEDADLDRAAVMAQVWAEHLPATEVGLAEQDLAYFTYRLADRRPDGRPPHSLPELVAGGWVIAEPIVYEDFLPRSAAGIFSSNLTSQGAVVSVHDGAARDRDWMAGVIDRPVAEPSELYDAQRRASFESVAAALDVPTLDVPPGLACREVSPAAWKVLEWLCSDYVAIADSWATEAMRVLAADGPDVPIVSGESAAGGMGVLLAAADDPGLRRGLGLYASSRVVLFGGEGATDPRLYEEIVGMSPTQVFDRQDAARRAMSAGR